MKVWIMAAVLLLSACGTTATTATTPPKAEEPAFDLALVKANFTAECTHPPFGVDLFCEHIDIDRMTADGSILNVPTNLNAAGSDRAAEVCGFFATVHYDGATGDDLGYETIGILDRNGGKLATCGTVSTVAP